MKRRSEKGNEIGYRILVTENEGVIGCWDSLDGLAKEFAICGLGDNIIEVQ